MYHYNKLVKLLFLICCLLSLTISNSIAQETSQRTDKELVYEAVENYVLALYNVEPERIAKSVDPTLRKIGYYDYNGKSYDHASMTYQQLYDLSASWNANGNQVTKDSPREIEIYQVHDRTASAKLTAKWGIDFMHLSKVNGQWKIMNIMWQSDPK